MFDRTFFFQSVRKSLFSGSLKQSQVDGLSRLLDTWESHYKTYDTRFLAYCLATSYHETAKTLQPIAEYGKGKGKAYGTPVNGKTYYGRGDVQLTWLENYQRASRELKQLGINVDLVSNPEKALDPVISAHVLFLGCIQGWFTGKRLDQYFNDKTDDPKGARRIVNGTDKAADIAKYHGLFLSAFKDSEAPSVQPKETEVAEFTKGEGWLLRLLNAIFSAFRK